MAWVDDWTEIVSVWETVDMTRATYDSFNAQAWLENELAKNGNVLSPRFVGDVVSYPGDGTELDKAGIDHGHPPRRVDHRPRGSGPPSPASGRSPGDPGDHDQDHAHRHRQVRRPGLRPGPS